MRALIAIAKWDGWRHKVRQLRPRDRAASWFHADCLAGASGSRNRFHHQALFIIFALAGHVSDEALMMPKIILYM